MLLTIKKIIQLGKFEDQTGFIKWFMNKVATHIASREMFWGAVQIGRFL